MDNTPLPTDVTPLGRVYRGLKVTPISSYYWSIHPYKLVLESKGWPRSPAQRRVGTASLLQAHITEAIPDFADKRIARLGTNQQKVFVYCTNKETVDRILDLCYDRVQQLDGPISTKHIEIMDDPHCSCVVRPHLWFHKYNMRVDIFTKRNVNNFFSDADAKAISHVVAVIKDNLVDPKISVYNRGGVVIVYTQYEEFMKFWAMFTLMCPGVNLTMERCFVNQDDKYLS